MSGIMNRLKRAADRRAACRRTARELRAMPLDVALDLDIDRADADHIARTSVYGASGSGR